VATLELLELQRTTVVMSWFVESLNTPVAVKLRCHPMGIVELNGVTVIDVMTALLTLNGTELETDPSVAVTVTRPGANPRACAPEVKLSTDVFDDDQVTSKLTLCVLPSVKVPVAIKPTLVPWAMFPLPGCIEIELRLLVSTVTEVLALADSNVADMVAVPTFFAVTRPLTVIGAMPGEDELHATTPVTSCLVLSEKVAVALNCWLTSSARVGFMGKMLSEVAVAEVTVRDAVAEIDPDEAVIVTLPAETP
jgi:hypothetical protein